MIFLFKEKFGNPQKFLSSKYSIYKVNVWNIATFGDTLSCLNDHIGRYVTNIQYP